MSNLAEWDWIGLVVGVLLAEGGYRLLGLGVGSMGGGVVGQRGCCAGERLLGVEFVRPRFLIQCAMVSSACEDSIADIVIEFVFFFFSLMDFADGYSADVLDASTLENKSKSSSPISISSLLDAVADDLKTLNKNLKTVSTY